MILTLNTSILKLFCAPENTVHKKQVGSFAENTTLWTKQENVKTSVY